VANEYGTPCYIYSRHALEKNYQCFANALKTVSHQICYAVKANSNLAILNVLANLGSGFDIVSLGELQRVIAAKGNPKKVVFSGVGKTKKEILAALEIGVYCFNVESELELERINELAQQMHVKARIALRINPNIDAQTHPYIATGLKENKFGIDIEDAKNIITTLDKYTHLQLIGIACHIGSQLTDLKPLMAAIDRIVELALTLQHTHPLEHINIGGGLGVAYQHETPPSIEDYIATALNHLAPCRNLKVIVEPGRAIVADTGILVTKVEYIKYTDHKNFAVVDVGMNDFLRPAL
jgi:diaminopimelate decarboxylase